MSVRLTILHPSGPGDVSALEAALAGLPVERVRQLALLAKTEGPATLNDVSRDLAMRAADEAIQGRGGQALLARSWRIFSVGCEGIATPAMFLFADVAEADEAGELAPRLVFGAARSRPLAAGALCRREHILAAAEAVHEAMARARLDDSQVRLVLVKSPVLAPTAAADLDPDQRRHAGSTGNARGAAALGAALGLGEIDAQALPPDPVCRDLHLYSMRTMAFSGTETDRLEVIVLGERPGAGGTLGIAVTVLEDLLDGAAVTRLRSELPLAADLVLFKAGIAADGRLRGRRTTVLGSDLPPDKQLRAAASGLLGAWFGAGDTFISAGAEHQGPPGACLCAVVGEAASG